MKTKEQIMYDNLPAMAIEVHGSSIKDAMEEYAKQFIEGQYNLTDTTEPNPDDIYTNHEGQNSFMGRRVFVWIPLSRYEELLTKEEQFDNQNAAKKPSVTN